MKQFETLIQWFSNVVFIEIKKNLSVKPDFNNVN